MDKDLNNEESVATQDLNKADVVNQQDLNKAGSVDQQNQEEKLADGTDPNKAVKYSELKKATDAKNESDARATDAEEKAAYAQRQLELMQQQALVNANPPQQPKSSMEQAMIDCGVVEDDLYGAAQVQVMNRKDQIDAARVQQQQANFSIQQFVLQHPDISQVVGSVNPVTGQITSMSPELMSLLTKKPHYAGGNLPILYDAVIQERELSKFEKEQVVLNEHQARTGVDSQALPMGGSAAGGGTGGDVQQKMMTREQVLDIERKLANGETV